MKIGEGFDGCGVYRPRETQRTGGGRQDDGPQETTAQRTALQ